MKTKLLLLHFLFPLFIFAQITQIGADIDGEAADDQSGGSVSLSADGSTVAIGAPENDGNGNNSGHVRIYQNTGNTWNQIGADIDGEEAYESLGSSVSLSADGSIVAIGAQWASGTNGPGDGQVRVYQNTGGVWSQIGEVIDGEAVADYSGTSVSLSSDGSIVAIGAPQNDGNGTNSGHVRIYQNTGGSWTQVGQDIDGEGVDDLSGETVSLSADGNTVAIGARWNDGNGYHSGHVRIYQNTGGTWTQIGIDIDGEASEDESGYPISLSADGGIVAIGARWNDGNGSNSGQVRVYQNTGGAWSQLGADINGETEEDDSGWSVSLSTDGSIVAIGARRNDGNGNASGHVRVYQNTEGTWTQIGADIDGEEAGDRSGRDISLSSDGSIVAIGAVHNDGNGNDSGHVRIFDLGIQQTLQASFASNTTNACVQDIVEFYDQSAGGAVSWDWTFEGGSPATSTSQNPMVVYFTPGIYDVTLTVGDGVELSTMAIEDYMTVESVPDTPETPGGDDEVCTNFTLTSEYITTDAMYAESYEWEILPAEAGTIDGTGITGTVTWTTDWEGTATIYVKAINEACGESELSDAFEVECSICTGICEYGDLAGIQVYPNPSNGQFTVKFNKNIGQAQIVVMNMLNEILYDRSIETMNGYAVSFDLSNYAEGVYFVRINTDSSEQIRKIIVH